MTEAYDSRQVVGMDLYRRRSVLVRMTEDGRKLEIVRITNSPAALRAGDRQGREAPGVVLEATYGWYWAADVLEAAGAEVHLAHPLGVKACSSGGSRTRSSATPRIWRDCCGWAGCRRRGSPRRRGRADLLRALDGLTGPDEPETRETLRDVATAVAARRGGLAAG